MKKTVNFYDFGEAMRHGGFSYVGLRTLYNYLCDLEDDMDIEIELDPVALRCEYSEYQDLEEFQNDYGDDYQSIKDIEDKTTVIRIDGDGFIVQNF